MSAPEVIVNEQAEAAALNSADDHDEALDQVEFELQTSVLFNASDVCQSLTCLQLVKLVQDLDTEASMWEVTILLARFFDLQMQIARAEVPQIVQMSDEELEARLRKVGEK